MLEVSSCHPHKILWSRAAVMLGRPMQLLSTWDEMNKINQCPRCNCYLDTSKLYKRKKTLRKQSGESQNKWQKLKLFWWERSSTGKRKKKRKIGLISQEWFSDPQLHRERMGRFIWGQSWIPAPPQALEHCCSSQAFWVFLGQFPSQQLASTP